MQWLILQQDKPDDFIATGYQYTVREFVSIAASKLDLEITGRQGRK